MTNAMTYTSQLKPLPGYDVSSCNCSRALTPLSVTELFTQIILRRVVAEMYLYKEWNTSCRIRHSISWESLYYITCINT